MLKGNWTNEGTLGAEETHYIYAKFNSEAPDLSGIINSRNLTTELSITLLFTGTFVNGTLKLFFYKDIVGTNAVAEVQINYIDENNLIWKVIDDKLSVFPCKTVLSSTNFSFDYKNY